MIIDTLFKITRKRYESLVIEMNEDYAELILEDAGAVEIESNLEYVREILNTLDLHGNDNYLDYAAACILLEELLIAQDQS